MSCSTSMTMWHSVQAPKFVVWKALVCWLLPDSLETFCFCAAFVLYQGQVGKSSSLVPRPCEASRSSCFFTSSWLSDQIFQQVVSDISSQLQSKGESPEDRSRNEGMCARFGEAAEMYRTRGTRTSVSSGQCCAGYFKFLGNSVWSNTDLNLSYIAIICFCCKSVNV